MRKAARWFAAGILTLGSLAGVAEPALAECDPSRAVVMPSFREVAPSAQRVIVGTVIEAINSPSTSPINFASFKLRVDEVLRGDANRIVTLIAIPTRVPFRQLDGLCPEPPIIYVNTGDVVAIAFGGHMRGVANPVNTAAWIEGEPSVLDRKAETLTLAQVRRATSLLPNTDTVHPGGSSSEGWRSAALPIVAVVAPYAWSIQRRGGTRRQMVVRR